MTAFWKKEWMAQWRTGKVFILGLLFVFLGVMNPATAKMTPWLLEMMGESLAASGLVINQVNITALDSWVQFFKNIPMALIVFVLLLGGILTEEYRSGTLILSLTKGLSRGKVLLTKALVLAVMWTVGYWLCFGITYLYTDFYWDQSVVQNLLFAAMLWWLFGLWMISLMVLFSAVANAASGVMLMCGGSCLAVYLLSFLPKMGDWMPTQLMNGTALIYGMDTPDSYGKVITITVVMMAIFVAAALPILHKKQL